MMGPWSVRNEKNPFAPGMSFEKLREMVSRGKISRTTIVRGPSTRQFWSLACNTPGVATLLGECHHCHAPVDPGAYLCAACGVVLSCSTDRQHLGLGPVKLLPGEAPAHEVASSTMSRAAERPAAPASAAAGAAHHVSTMQPHVAAAPITPAAPEPPTSLRRDRRARAKGQGAVIPVLAFIALAGLIVLVALVTGRAG
ncbi:MAG: hypothetical protein SFZ24_10805 [Planctomycetota bacterium]|nr:hypothetical protein [Planctomycetota bacterium]